MLLSIMTVALALWLLEMTLNSVIGAILVCAVLGLDLEAGAVYTFCTAAGEFVCHANVATPRWIGYFFQRPEMHRIHHEHGRHRNNYGDVVWWDMLFGAYENPVVAPRRCGFDDGREQRLIDMLVFRDVHRGDSAPRRGSGAAAISDKVGAGRPAR